MRNPACGITVRHISRISCTPPIAQIINQPDTSFRHILLKKGGGSGTGWFILAAIAAAIGLFTMLRKRGKPAANSQAQPQAAQQAVSQPQEQEPQEKPAQAAGAVAGATLASAAKPTTRASKPQPAKKEEEPYKYGYGGGSFGGGGASSSW